MTSKYLRIWCDCGATASACSSPPFGADSVITAFRTIHEGMGHETTTDAGRGRAWRRRAQRAEDGAILAAERAERGL